MLESYLSMLQEAIELSKFDEDYYNDLPKDKKEIFYNPKRAHYHILIDGNSKVGIAGVILNPKYKDFGFFQIYIEKEHRGKGILREAAILIFKKYKLKTLIATVKKYNKASIKGHLKAGFKEVDSSIQHDLIARGYQKKDEVRFVFYG